MDKCDKCDNRREDCDPHDNQCRCSESGGALPQELHGEVVLLVLRERAGVNSYGCPEALHNAWPILVGGRLDESLRVLQVVLVAPRANGCYESHKRESAANKAYCVPRHLIASADLRGL